jgi:hypothetical protein
VTPQAFSFVRITRAHAREQRTPATPQTSAASTPLNATHFIERAPGQRAEYYYRIVPQPRLFRPVAVLTVGVRGAGAYLDAVTDIAIWRCSVTQPAGPIDHDLRRV